MDLPWGVGVAQAVSIFKSTPTQTAKGIFQSSCQQYSRLETFDFGYSTRNHPSSRTRPTITFADDPRSHWFCPISEWPLSYQKSPVSQEIPAARASKAISTVYHSTATGSIPFLPSRERAQSFIATLHHIARIRPKNCSTCRE
jgi:hypothetical protein